MGITTLEQQEKHAEQKNYGASSQMLFQTFQQSFPPYTSINTDDASLIHYFSEYKEEINQFLEKFNIQTKEELFEYLFASNNITPYQRKTLNYLQKRVSNISLNIHKDLGNKEKLSQANMDEHDIQLNLLEVALVASFNNLNFDTTLALTTIHEYNHVLNHHPYQGNITIFAENEKELKDFDVIKKMSKRMGELKDILKEYHKEHPYKDAIRLGDDRYITGNDIEFMTESVSNEHFMAYLSKIPYNTPQSRYDAHIQANLKNSGISFEQNTLLYACLDLYYTGINHKTRMIDQQRKGKE